MKGDCYEKNYDCGVGNGDLFFFCCDILRGILSYHRERDMSESRVGLGFSIPIPFFGEGKNTNYETRNEDSEFHVVGLASAPKIYGKSQEAYFEKYDGSLKSLKEFGHGLTSIVHIYNTKSNGSKKLFPGFFTLEKEGSVFAPILGLVAFPVNLTSKLFGGDDLMYNAW